jgi:hypothetical protein
MGMQMGRSGLSLNDRSITGDEQSHHTRLSLHVYNYMYTRCCECARVEGGFDMEDATRCVISVRVVNRRSDQTQMVM